MGDAHHGSDLDMLIEDDDADVDEQEQELDRMGEDEAKGRVQAQMAARAAEAAMRGNLHDGQGDGNEGIYGGHRYRNR
jgi:hypothetical protein